MMTIETASIIALMICMYLFTYGLGYLHGQLDMTREERRREDDDYEDTEDEVTWGAGGDDVTEEKKPEPEKKIDIDTSDLREQLLKEKFEMALKN